MMLMIEYMIDFAIWSKNSIEFQVHPILLLSMFNFCA